jgi:hypothetical protein
LIRECGRLLERGVFFLEMRLRGLIGIGIGVGTGGVAGGGEAGEVGVGWVDEGEGEEEVPFGRVVGVWRGRLKVLVFGEVDWGRWEFVYPCIRRRCIDRYRSRRVL